MDQVVLQFTDFFRYVFLNPTRILAYLNSFFAKYMNSIQYCEETENGFLFIFQDFEAFQKRAQPIQAPKLVSPDLQQIPEDQIQFFQGFFIKKEDFPAEGVEIEVKIIQGDPKAVKPIMNAFIHSVNASISIRDIDESTIVFHIQKYDIIQAYVNSLLHRFYLRSAK